MKTTAKKSVTAVTTKKPVVKVGKDKPAKKEFVAVQSAYNGKPTLVIYDKAKYDADEGEEGNKGAFVVAFGKGKATAIAACIDDIQAFVDGE